jgi:serine/threonine protein kinase
VRHDDRVATPSTIGRLRIERQLGAGGFATVWLAHDPELDSPVAVKILAENFSAQADIRRRFIDEARLLRRVDSDHMVRVYDVGELPDGRPFFVMTYADGGTLADRLARVPPPWQPHSVVAVVDAVAEALTVLHRHGVVHRDIKPVNILLRATPDDGERVVLGDLGIAKDLQWASGLTMPTGSSGYAAPEQEFYSETIGPATDVHALAVTTAQLLGLRPPWPQSPLGATLARATAPDPRQRTQTPKAFATQLRESLAAYGAPAPPPRPGAPMTPMTPMTPMSLPAAGRSPIPPSPAPPRPLAPPPSAQPPAAQPPLAQPPVAHPPVAHPPVAHPPVAHPPVAHPPVARPPVSPPPPAPPLPGPQPPPAPPAAGMAPPPTAPPGAPTQVVAPFPQGGTSLGPFPGAAPGPSRPPGPPPGPLSRPPSGPLPAPVSGPRRPLLLPAAAAGVAAVVIVGGGWAGWTLLHGTQTLTPVNGRVSVQVPRDWSERTNVSFPGMGDTKAGIRAGSGNRSVTVAFRTSGADPSDVLTPVQPQDCTPSGSRAVQVGSWNGRTESFSGCQGGSQVDEVVLTGGGSSGWTVWIEVRSRSGSPELEDVLRSLEVSPP